MQENHNVSIPTFKQCILFSLVTKTEIKAYVDRKNSVCLSSATRQTNKAKLHGTNPKARAIRAYDAAYLALGEWFCSLGRWTPTLLRNEHWSVL